VGEWQRIAYGGGMQHTRHPLTIGDGFRLGIGMFIAQACLLFIIVGLMVFAGFLVPS
jgi:hypothetical protein